MDLNEERLFGYLKKDGIEIDEQVIKEAQEGVGEALWSIGYEYDVGKQQYEKAMAWFLLSAQKDYSHAQNNIGMLYRNGQGVNTDFLAALEWWLRAAKQGNVLSFINIGDLFSNGQGVPKNDAKAQQWYHVNEVKSDKDIILKNLIDETNAILIAETKRRKQRAQVKEGNKSSLRSKPKADLFVEKKGKKEENKEKDEKNQEEPSSASDTDSTTVKKGPHPLKQHKHKHTDMIKNVQEKDSIETSNTGDEIDALKDKLVTDNNTIALLTERVSKLHKAYAKKKLELETLKTTKETIESEGNALKLQNQQLKEASMALQDKLRNRDRMINSMKKKAHQSSCKEDHQLQDNEEIKDTFRMLVRSQANEIELLKQNMKMMLEKEKKSKRRLKKENQVLKRRIEEVERVSIQSVEDETRKSAVSANQIHEERNSNKNTVMKKRKVTFDELIL